jgi:hypothetical protein
MAAETMVDGTGYGKRLIRVYIMEVWACLSRISKYIHLIYSTYMEVKSMKEGRLVTNWWSEWGQPLVNCLP